MKPICEKIKILGMPEMIDLQNEDTTYAVSVPPIAMTKDRDQTIMVHETI